VRNIVPNKKQKLSLEQKYKLYLSKLPLSKGSLSNKYNLLDDLNSTDKVMMNELRISMIALSVERKRLAAIDSA
jgi:hypothetical protein